MIKAPYNFVPLAENLVFPEWASQISIDLPFEDGVSGTIKVKYTAQTPIFIGNSKENKDAAVIPNYTSANGKYAIPGSSLRGMFRNVIEIISFGKFNRVSNSTLSVRDLQNNKLYTKYFTENEKGVFKALSKAGWLKQDEKTGEWSLFPVEYHRVEDADLETLYRTNLRSPKPEERLRRISHKVRVFFNAGPVQDHKHHFDQRTGKNLRLKYSKVEKINFTEFAGSKVGFTVLTGSCGRKHLDFIFEDKKTTVIPVSQKIIKTFDDINMSNAANQKEGIEIRKKLSVYTKNGYPGIPVFYLNNKQGELDSIGLAQMFKLPYEYTLHDAIKHSSPDNFLDNLDFAECMFGKIKSKKNDSSKYNYSLRGRIQFEDATTDSQTLGQTINTVLENPKPTYYPNYIVQETNNENYKTLMDPDVQLRGWKRYPVRNKEKPMSVVNDQIKVGSSFTPLPKEISFEGKIHFHNLKKEELGALLWAITWGNDKELSHSVGMGKPYGFGQIKADILLLEFLYNNSNDNNYCKASENEIKGFEDIFEKYMGSKIKNWSTSSQIKELKAMANPENASRPNWKLQYMSLKNDEGTNEFIAAKKSKSYLGSYSLNCQEMHL